MRDMQCALWYWRHHRIVFDIHPDELSAIRTAYYMYEDGEGVPEGVQFKDGTYVPMLYWTEYQQYENQAREDEERRIQEAMARPKPEMKIIYAPFPEDKEWPIHTLASTPDWVGSPEPIIVYGTNMSTGTIINDS